MAVPTIYAKLIETFNKEQMDRDSIETACKAIRYICDTLFGSLSMAGSCMVRYRMSKKFSQVFVVYSLYKRLKKAAKNVPPLVVRPLREVGG